MFEAIEVDDEDATACADALVASVEQQRRVAAQRMARIARWADLHHPDRDLPVDLPPAVSEARRCRQQLGADGTPEVSTYAGTELGMLLQTTTRAAEALLRDVLEIRHRLPRLWSAVLTGQVADWKAREVAKQTRVLTFEQAVQVDALVVEALIGLPWGRALAVVQGKVIAVDPVGHEERREGEEARRFVSTRRRANVHGLRTLIARGSAGDIARLEAMIAHVAGLLQRAGDTDGADARRAKALALLANPALACVFLADAHEPSEAADTDTEPDPSGDGPSAVDLGVELGKVLRRLGAKALDRLRPRSVIYLHLAHEAITGQLGTGVIRVEDPVAANAIGIPQLKEWLAHDRVTVRPVFDPAGQEPVDSYEIAQHLREAQHLLAPYEVFPYGTLPSRQCDLDHTVAYREQVEGGPPGQTAIGNLGGLGRSHHLAKTFDGFTVHQPVPGLYFWRTPTGYWFQVDHRGTTALGRDRPAALGPVDRLDETAMSAAELSFRAMVVRHLAA